MKRFKHLSAAVAVVTALAASLAFTAAADNPRLRVMPLGDSITEGVGSAQGGGYRTPLYTMLKNLGYNVDLVGANTANPSSILTEAGEIHHEGHSGWRISHPSAGLYEHLFDWARSFETPNVILVHVGTNDTNDNDYEHAIDRLDLLVDRLVECHPDAYIVVTTLLEREPANLNDKIHQYFNPFVEGRVAAQVAKGHTRVRFLDMNQVVPLSNMPDNLHPNDTGYAQMAEAWTAAIQEIFPDPSQIDTPSPAFLSVTGTTGRKTLTAYFNEMVEKTSAETLANYAFSGGTIVSAELSGDGRTLLLTLDAPLEEGGSFTLSANNVLSADGRASSATSKAFSAALVQGASRNVPSEEFGLYEKVYAMNLPSRNAVFQNEHVTYDEDYHFTTPKFTRVAYYLELRRPGENLEYIWVSMDAFTDDVLKIGIPTIASGAQFQQYVTNLKIYSNSPNVEPGTREQGNIEFWPSNYEGANAANIPGADGGKFDFGDRISAGNYGSMQVHDYTRGKTLFAYNRWGGGGSTYQQGIGIGSYTGTNGNPDWTHVENSESYDIRRLEVYVMPDAADLTPPQIVSAELGLGRRTVTVTFDEPVSEQGLGTAFAVGDYGVASVRRLPRTRTDKQATRVYLTLSRAVPETDTDVALTLGGVRDTSPHANAVPPGTTAPITQGGAGLPSETLIVSPALTAGYKLLYTVDVPLQSDWPSKQDALYTVNEYGPAIGSFDRVAYYYELDKANSGSAYVWVSMDAWSQDARQLGVPSAKQSIMPGGFFVHNLEVESNGGAAQTRGADGFVEFWPNNYNNAKQTYVPGQDASCYNMGDRLETGGDYGCMQVHNVTAASTVFAINHFGGNGFTIATGIGPSQKANNANSTDWTFRENAGDYVARRLHVLVRPCPALSPDDASLDVPADVTALVDDAAGYKLLYKIDVPQNASFGDATRRASCYAVDNRTKLPENAARVAYLLRLTDGNGVRWAWTAFDMPCAGFTLLDVPLNSTLQRKVSNLDVFSNVEGIVTGRGIATGCIEFGSGNYSQGTVLGVGDGSIFDCDDTLTAGTGHGTMQVHNYAERQTVWSMNHFNNNSVPGLFIGNDASRSDAPDGTFTYNAADFTSRELFVMVKYDDTSAPAEVVDRVPDAANYQLLYKIDIPVNASFQDAASRAACYLVDNSGRLSPRPVRVAYMMDLDGQWVWTSFKSLARTLGYLGVPYNAIVQGKVEDMDVFSNVDGIATGTHLETGCIEFCAGNYAQGTALGVGNGSIYDCDDTLQAGPGGHGSMQVHNWQANQTLWAVNNFNNNKTPGIGIGNDPERKSNATDWTFQTNAGNYTKRTLYVLVNYDGVADSYDENAAAGSAPINQVVAAKDGSSLAVCFRSAPAPAHTVKANFSIDGAEIVSVANSAYDERDVILSFASPLAAGGAYTLVYTCGGERQERAFTVGGTASAALANVPEAADYALVYQYAIPATVSASYGFAYAVDESRFGPMAFDRVAYLMELTDGAGKAQWAWASMDAFTGDLSLIAIPTPWRPGSTFQCYVENLFVAGGSSTGASPVQTGSFAQGNIEFWPNSYTTANAVGIPGADGASYDFGDQITSGGYGSMQVHNYMKRETVFSFSHFYDGGTGLLKPSLGIGNDEPDTGHSGSTDWTFRENAANYTLRSLSVFVRPSGGESQGHGPVFTVQPQNVRVRKNAEPVVLSAFAPGAAFYQWRKNGQPITGATSRFLEVRAETESRGTYDVVAYVDGANFTVSSAATVEIVQPPTMILVR